VVNSTALLLSQNFSSQVREFLTSLFTDFPVDLKLLINNSFSELNSGPLGVYQCLNTWQPSRCSLKEICSRFIIYHRMPYKSADVPLLPSDLEEFVDELKKNREVASINFSIRSRHLFSESLKLCTDLQLLFLRQKRILSEYYRNVQAYIEKHHENAPSEPFSRLKFERFLKQTEREGCFSDVDYFLQHSDQFQQQMEDNLPHLLDDEWGDLLTDELTEWNDELNTEWEYEWYGVLTDDWDDEDDDLDYSDYSDELL